MKRNGFTLIELLAVIVILAIIALIATPIILNIINDAKEESQERSIELYASAAKNAVAKYQLNNTGVPTSFDQLDIEYDGDVECTTKELYSDGSIYLAGCSVNGTLIEGYTYGSLEVKIVKLSDVCTPSTTQDYATNATDSGYRYECDVDPTKEGNDYTFYVLNSTDESVNLIMDSNINKSGEAVKTFDFTVDYVAVAWINQTDYESLKGSSLVNDDGACQWEGLCEFGEYGPITALNYLQEATKNWTKLNPITINSFNDENGDSYEMQEYKLYARMPYVSELDDVDSKILYNYLYDYLEEGLITNSASPFGYWTLSIVKNSNLYYGDYVTAYFVSCEGNIYEGFVGGEGKSSGSTSADGSGVGVRPVITLSI